MDYRIWRKFLENLCGDKNLFLTQSLGEWKRHSYNAWLAKWDWFVTTDTEITYYQYTRNKWCFHQRKINRHYSFDLNSQHYISEQKGEIWRATITIQKTEIDLNN